MLSPLLSIASPCACRFGHVGVIINNHLQGRREIRAQVDTLARDFDFIGLDELKSAIKQRRKRPFCLLTFDDGKQIQVEATEELERLGIPAAIYVVTASMDSPEPLWFDKLRALREAGVPLPDDLQQSHIKKHPLADIQPRVDEACRRFGVDAEAEDPRSQAFAWETARDLDRRGFTIGAHTVDHAILTNETFSKAERQIRASIEAVSEALGKPCTTFAFPRGRYTDDLLRMAQAAGAEDTMTTEPVWVRRDTPLIRLPRVQLSERASPDKCRAKLVAALPGFILKK